MSMFECTSTHNLQTAAWLYHTPRLLPSVECETSPYRLDLKLAGNAIIVSADSFNTSQSYLHVEKHVLFHYLSFLKSYPDNVERNTPLLHIMSETLLGLLREDACHHRLHVCNREDLCMVFYELCVYMGDTNDEISGV